MAPYSVDSLSCVYRLALLLALHQLRLFCPINCFREMTWKKRAIGTKNPGSQTKGKSAMKVLAGLFINTRIGVGMESTAITTIVKSNASPSIL